jgi:hypothetical protein
MGNGVGQDVAQVVMRVHRMMIVSAAAELVELAKLARGRQTVDHAVPLTRVSAPVERHAAI